MLDKYQTTTVAEFKIEHLQFLDKAGKPTQDLPEFAKQSDKLIDLYKLMTLTRMIDNKTINLQRVGKLTTFPASSGQEAISVAMGYCLEKDDVYVSSYRDHGCLIQRDVEINEILSYWGGDERASNFKSNKKDFPACMPIATHLLHAAGVAFAMQYKNESNAVLTMSGEGGTSEGDFYESINLAGAWNLPIVYVVNNNHWAISLPSDKQTAAKTFAQKAIAAGMPSIQVDGDDIIALITAISTALENARNGKGPMLIEALTYRICDHTTADDATRYRSNEALDAAKANDPVLRLREYLLGKNLWNEDKEKALLAELKAKIEAEVKLYLNKPAPDVTESFDYLYAELPDAYLEQRNSIGDDNV